MTNPPLISLSERAYGTLLRLYPAGFRREYGTQMAQVFGDVCRQTYRTRGMFGIALWWYATLLDLTLTAIEQWRKAPLDLMLRALIIQLTGLALILGGVCGAIAAFSQLQPGDHDNYYGIYQVAIVFIIPAYLLIGLGGMGIVLRYGATAEQVGRLALLGNGIGGLLIAFGISFSRAQSSLWTVAVIGMVVHAASAVVFSLTSLRSKSLPVAGWLPPLAGVTLLMLIAGVFRTSTSSSGDLVAFAYLLIYSVLWIVIGAAIQRHQAQTVPAAPA